MMLLTLGTYPLPFDRLVKAIDELIDQRVIDCDIFAQIGHSNYIPKNMRYERLIEKDRFDSLCASSSALISHGGMGSIMMALEHSKPLLIMPRLKQFGEVVNDHQVGTAKEFERMGHVLVAYGADELPGKIRQLKDFKPATRVCQAEKVAQRIAEFLEGLSDNVQFEGTVI